MKILQVIDSLHIGGAEKLLIEEIPLLVDRGLEIDVAVLNGERTEFYKDLEEKRCCNIISLGRRYYDIRHFYKLYKLAKKYDIIHVHLFPAQYYVAILKLFGLIKCNIVFTEHSTSNRRLQNSYLRKVERFIYRAYNKVICITDNVKEVLLLAEVIDPLKLQTIENGVNISNIINSNVLNRNDFGFSNDDFLLIMVAGFRREKDQDTVIRSLVKLPEKYKLILVGDGERRLELENLVKELDLIERVSFLGIRNDVYGLMKMCDVAILSSHWEGFGLVAVEAMASGTPLIASNVSGLAEVVEKGGLLFEKGNAEELSRNIILLNNDVFYNSIVEKGKERSLLYDISNAISELENLYSCIYVEQYKL